LEVKQAKSLVCTLETPGTVKFLRHF